MPKGVCNRQIKTVFQLLDFLHRLCGRWQQLDVRYAVQPVIGNIVVSVIIADQIVASVCRRDLIGIDDIFTDPAVAVPPRMQSFIGAVAVVRKGYLTVLADRFVQNLDGVKKLLTVQG